MRNERGFNMVGVIIAAGLFAFLALAASEFLSNMFKGIRAVDVKMQSQDFASTLRLALSKQDQCILLLGLDKTPLELPIEEYEKAVKGAEIAIPVPQIVLGKKVYKKDTEVQDLKLLEMSIRISSPDAKDGNEHTGALVAPLELLRGKKMYTIPQYLAKIPLKVKVERDGAKAKVVACNSETPAIDPQVVCTDLGGRWLTGEHMPKDRCSVGADITLAANELPEGIPGQGGTNADGERVEACYYQKPGDSRVLEYVCPNSWGTRKGPRCAFDVKSGLWGVWDFNSSGVAKKLRFNCIKGVKISVKTPDSAYLELDEPVYKGWDDNPPADMEASGFSATDQDRLTAAGRCQYLPDAELYYDCSNNTAANALQAKTGSCVFVKGIRFGAGSAAAARIASYNNLNGTAVNPAAYTGWVRVGSARAFIPKGGSPAQSLIREATGNPCFRVEMRLANAGDTGLGQPAVAAPADLKADPTQVRQCVHEATASESMGTGAVAGAPAKRKSIFPCDNSALSPDELVDLAVGQCWFVRDTRIIGYHEGGAGGNVAAPATGGGDLGTRYTGWVYLKAQLPDGRFTLNGDGELVPTTPNANSSRVNAMPCNAGIRAPLPAEAP